MARVEGNVDEITRILGLEQTPDSRPYVAIVCRFYSTFCTFGTVRFYSNCLSILIVLYVYDGAFFIEVLDYSRF